MKGCIGLQINSKNETQQTGDFGMTSVIYSCVPRVINTNCCLLFVCCLWAFRKKIENLSKWNILQQLMENEVNIHVIVANVNIPTVTHVKTQ